MSKKCTSLAMRVAVLPSDKVIDVSNINPNGTGAVAIKKPTRKSKKIGSSNLAIVSDNFDRYMIAIDLLPNGRTVYKRDIEHVAKEFGVKLNLNENDNEVRNDTSDDSQESSDESESITSLLKSPKTSSDESENFNTDDDSDTIEALLMTDSDSESYDDQYYDPLENSEDDY